MKKLLLWMRKSFNLGEYDVVRDQLHLPCYASRFTVENEIQTEKDVRKYISLARKTEKKGMVVFSVTEEDKYHKVWLKVAQSLPGATVTCCRSRMHEGYMCYLIVIPVEVKFSKVKT